MYGVSTVLLVLALRHGELSLLYPVFAMTYVWVTILSVLMLPRIDERLQAGGHRDDCRRASPFWEEGAIRREQHSVIVDGVGAGGVVFRQLWGVVSEDRRGKAGEEHCLGGHQLAADAGNRLLPVLVGVVRAGRPQGRAERALSDGLSRIGVDAVLGEAGAGRAAHAPQVRRAGNDSVRDRAAGPGTR